MRIFPFLTFLVTTFIGVTSIINNALPINGLGFWVIVLVIFAAGVYWARNSTKNKVENLQQPVQDWGQTSLSKEDEERLQNELDMIQGIDN